MGDDLEIVEFDDFASGDEEEEEEISEDIPDEIITQPAKRVTQDVLLAQFPDGLVLDIHVFCEKCKTLYSAHLEPHKLSESEIALIYAVEWKPRLIMTEEVAEVDLLVLVDGPQNKDEDGDDEEDDEDVFHVDPRWRGGELADAVSIANRGAGYSRI